MQLLKYPLQFIINFEKAIHWCAFCSFKFGGLYMAFSFSSCAITKPFFGVQERSLNCEVLKKNGVSALIKCSSKESSELPEKGSKLEIGSPIIFIEAPKMIKTAATMPCLRVNTGQVKAGDVGRYFTSSSTNSI